MLAPEPQGGRRTVAERILLMNRRAKRRVMSGLLSSLLPGVLSSAILCAPGGTAVAATPRAAAPAAPVAPVNAVIPARATEVVTTEGITEYRLPNGLRIVLAPDASRPSTTVNMTYLVGSRHENYGETGMAHLLEHLLFKGTPSLPGRTIPTEFARRGMAYNGTTTQDRTNYFETFTASDDNLDWALRMEADRMVNSFVARSDLDSEMTVVRNEMEIGENSPARMLIQKMLAAAYQWHNYGKAPIGARSDVEQVGIDRLQAFYRRYYQPDNAVLVVAGKFDPAATLARIERYFGAIPRPARVLPVEHTIEPAQEGVREVVITRPGDSALVAAQYHVAPGAHPDTTAMAMLSVILADGPSSRLYQALVQAQKAASVRTVYHVLKDPGAILFMAEVGKAQSAEAARTALVDVLEGFAAKPVTSEEVERARVVMRNAYEGYMNDPGALGIALSEAIAKGDWRLFLVARDRVEKLTVDDVQRVALNYFVPSNRTAGIFVPSDHPARAQIPAAPDVGQLVAGYQGKPAATAVPDFDTGPANIEAHTRRYEFGNGMQVALLPKPTRGAVVEGVLTLRMGDVDSLRHLNTVGSLASAMLLRGAGALDRQQITDRIAALKATVHVSGSAERVNVRFETRREHLTELMSLLRTVLREPTFPQKEFDTLRAGNVVAMESVMRQPGTLAGNALGRHGNPYPPGDVRYTATLEENLGNMKAATLDQLRDFYARFYGTSHAQLAIVGDFDADTAAAQARTLFGDWTAPMPYARVDRPFVPIPPAGLTLQTPGKANAVFVATLPVDLTDESPDYAALRLADRVFGGNGMRSRLAERLRQREGLSYGAGSWLQVGALDRAGRFGLQAQYAPQNRDKVETAVREELARLVRDGVTAAELEEARNGLLQARALERSDDGTLASILGNQLYLGRTMADTAQLDERLRTATREDVNTAIRKYLAPDALTQVYAGDFTGNPASSATTAAATSS